MNFLKKIIFGTAVFALSISALFLIAPLILQPYAQQIPSVNIIQFTVILIFSFVISVANRIFDSKKLHIALKILIHYVSVATSFVILFASWNPESFSSAGAYFIAIFLFSFVYALVFVGIYVGKILYAKSKLSKAKPNAKTKSNQQSENEYKPRFK